MKILVIVLLLFALPVVAGDRVESLPELMKKSPIPAAARNPWSPDLEKAYWERVRRCFEHWDYNGRYGNTYFENEKSSYPRAFIDLLEGNREPALKFLQAEDSDPHARKATLAVDWYPSFTIKSQVRKYFFFGPDLDPDYRKKMFDAARRWTEIDPLNRPNDFFEGRKDGWNVESKNSWVDVRNTDNLRAMREVSVYLMAEETGNKETAEIYKRRIRDYANALFQTGMGEWDSANYLHHGLTAWFQLYDYAKDEQVRLLGKAVLDWIHAVAAVKYFHGNWAGPNKRDYNNLPQFEGAPGFFWLVFADTPIAPEDPEFDLVHQITSPYRPPEAVVALAQKNFAKPVEILSSKPSYDGWFRKPGGEDSPLFHETVFIGEEFQVGTLPGGHEGDVCGFRLATTNTKIGSDIWVLSTALKGYVDGIATGTAGGDRIAQNRNAIIYANPKGDVPFYFLIPESARLEKVDDVQVFIGEKAWIAVKPVRAEIQGMDSRATEEIRSGKRPLPGHKIWRANGKSGGASALILEIADHSSHKSFEAFARAVLSKSRVDLEKLRAGEIHYESSTGTKVGLRMDEGKPPVVFRDGRVHDWNLHWALYQSAPGSESTPISLGWKDGTLQVSAGGHVFTGTMKNEMYSFTNKQPSNQSLQNPTLP